jgi:hypothetical protein
MTTKIPPMPRLDIDQTYRSLKWPGILGVEWRPTADHIIERQIVWALLHCLIAEFPEAPLAVYDGGETIRCVDPTAAMEAIFAVDEAVIRLGRQWVCLVMGNGRDVVADYGVNPGVEAAVNAAMVAVGLE